MSLLVPQARATPDPGRVLSHGDECGHSHGCKFRTESCAATVCLLERLSKQVFVVLPSSTTSFVLTLLEACLAVSIDKQQGLLHMYLSIVCI